MKREGAGEGVGAEPPSSVGNRRAASAAAPKGGRKAAAGRKAAPPPGDTDEATAATAAAEAAEADAAKPPAAKRARTSRATKQPAAAADAAGAEDAPSEEGAAAAAKPAKARKPRSKAAAPAADADAPASDAPPADAAAPAAPKAKAPPKPRAAAKSKTPAEPLPQYTAALRKPPPPAGTPTLKVLSWNVAGLRALVKKDPGALDRLVEAEGAQVLCLQEHKLQAGHTAEAEASMGLKGWSHLWATSSAKLGYSGVSIHTRTPPLAVSIGLADPQPAPGASPAAVAAAAAAAAAAASEAAEAVDPEHESEGRVVTVELAAVFVVCAYVPNSGEGLKRLAYRVGSWDVAFAAFIKRLQARGKPVVVTGDLNCAHHEIDIHAPKTNLRSAGFTLEERESFGRLLVNEVGGEGAGLADTFRELFPNTVAYTYFTRRFNCRASNKGWRLDYFLASRSLMPPAAPEAEAAPAAAAAAAAAASPSGWRVYDSWILQDVYGSDHLPLGLTLVQGA